MATPLQRRIESVTGVTRARTRAIRRKMLRNAMRRKSRGGQGG